MKSSFTATKSNCTLSVFPYEDAPNPLKENSLLSTMVSTIRNGPNYMFFAYPDRVDEITSDPECMWITTPWGISYITLNEIAIEFPELSGFELKAKASEILNDDLAHYRKWVNGDFYAYTIADASGEIIDSCYYFDEFDDAKNEGFEALQQIVADKQSSKPFIATLKYQMTLAESGQESLLESCGNGMFRLKE
jgi:hypothetical protein